MLDALITHISYTLGREYGWWEIDIHGCYSLVKIVLRQFARARTIDEYDVKMLVYPVRVTSQINCGDVTMPWKTVLDDNCDMSDRWLFSEKMCVKDIKLRIRNKIIHLLPWTTILGSLVMRFTNDFVTRENHWQITSLVTQKSLFTVTHALFLIYSIWLLVETKLVGFFLFLCDLFV